MQSLSFLKIQNTYGLEPYNPKIKFSLNKKITTEIVYKKGFSKRFIATNKSDSQKRILHEIKLSFAILIKKLTLLNFMHVSKILSYSDIPLFLYYSLFVG